METVFRPAVPEDTLGMAGVYLAAFPESLRYFFGEHPPRPQAVADLLVIPLLAEPGCGTVALGDGAIVGYCLAPAYTSRLSRVVWRGHLWRMLGRWISGGYGLGLRAVLRLGRNKLTAAGRDRFHEEAHILSIAVHPAYHRMGLGKELLRRGLEYLDRSGARRVRLEVRPDNAPALHLYERSGFAVVGRTRDSQGEWLIMLREARA